MRFHLPFSANEFDVTLSQALLIRTSDKKQAVREAIRVTKPGGFIGWLELSFYKHLPRGSSSSGGIVGLCLLYSQIS